MSILSQNWYNRNASRRYPLDTAATGETDDGAHTPHDILVDCGLRFPNTVGNYAYVSSIHVSPNLVSVTFLASFASAVGFICDGDPEDAAADVFTPLAAVSVPRSALIPGQQYPVDALYPGAGGWVVFGSLTELDTFSGRYSSVSQSMLNPRLSQPYAPLPLPDMSKLYAETQLTGLVLVRAGADIEIFKDQREIDGDDRDAMVIRLADVGGPRNTLELYTGPCGGRPESRTCNKPAIEAINSVKPDCDGNINIRFTTCCVDVGEDVNQEEGLVVDFCHGLENACLPDDLPKDGQLPNDYRDRCLPSDSVDDVIVDGSEGVGSEAPVPDVPTVASGCLGIPYTTTFDTAELTHWPTRLTLGGSDPSFTEISGVTIGNVAENSEILWVIEDSSAPSSIWAIAKNGQIRQEYQFNGALHFNVDYESVTSCVVGDKNYIYVGDTGDNANGRDGSTETGAVTDYPCIYRFEEPTVPELRFPGKTLGSVTKIKFQYPAVPAGDDGINPERDAESLFADPATGDLYIISKRTASPQLFRLPHAGTYPAVSTVTYQGDLTIPGFPAGPNDAAISPDGVHILVKRLGTIHHWIRDSETITQALTRAPDYEVDSYTAEPGGEAVCWDPDGLSIYTLSEGVNQPIFEYPFFDPQIPLGFRKIIGNFVSSAGNYWAKGASRKHISVWDDCSYDNVVGYTGEVTLSLVNEGPTPNGGLVVGYRTNRVPDDCYIAEINKRNDAFRVRYFTGTHYVELATANPVGLQFGRTYKIVVEATDEGSVSAASSAAFNNAHNPESARATRAAAETAGSRITLLTCKLFDGGTLLATIPITTVRLNADEYIDTRRFGVHAHQGSTKFHSFHVEAN